LVFVFFGALGLPASRRESPAGRFLSRSVFSADFEAGGDGDAEATALASAGRSFVSTLPRLRDTTACFTLLEAAVYLNRPSSYFTAGDKTSVAEIRSTTVPFSGRFEALASIGDVCKLCFGACPSAYCADAGKRLPTTGSDVFC